MTYAKAKELLSVDVSNLNETEAQKYKVRIIDAWRYARGDYGYNNDFFVWVGELRAFAPRDYWLLKNIETRMDLLKI